MAVLFNTTASRLLSARRTEAVTLQGQLDEIRKSKVVAEKEIEEAKAKLAEYEKKFGVLDGAREHQ